LVKENEYNFQLPGKPTREKDFDATEFKKFSHLISKGAVEISDEQLAHIACSETSLTFSTRVWMQAYFNLTGDQITNRAEIHLDPVTKKEIWSEYKSDMIDLFHEDFVSYPQFTRIWKIAFPNVKIRVYKQVNYSRIDILKI
jgi:hypothetical protein